MKIARIAIKNFLGLDHLDIAIERPVLLVAGPNASGKTSIVHGLRFVLTDDLVRVEHKKNIKELIREGAKLGSVSVSVMNSDTDTGTVFEYTRSAATGHFTSPHPPPEPNPALRYCLHPAAFTAMSAQERRGFLYKLMGVKISATDIVAQLVEARKHPPEIVARIATSLRSGFPAAYTEAMGIGRELKGEWRALTGETYGEVKGESWSVMTPEASQGDIDRLKQDLGQMDTDIRILHSKHGAITERAAERQRLVKRMAETARIAAEREARERAVKDVRTQLDKLTAEEKDVRETLEKAKLAVTVEAHAAQGAFFECPSCKTPLVYSRGECKVCPETAYSVDAVKEAVAAEKLVKEIELVLNEVSNHKRIADRLLVDAINAVGQSQAAADALKDLSAPQDEGEVQSDTGIEEEIAVKVAARFAAQQALSQLEEASRLHDEATTKTSRARALHEDIKGIAALAADLAPDGLPAELLSKAMRPINERLRDSAVMAGWSSVSITTDEILVHERHWDLASRSERWRAEAMIGAAIAQLSGIKCLVLDELDVLEPALRSGAIAWLAEIAEDFDTIVVMATLKAPPQNLPGAIQSVWLGEEEPAGHALS